LRDCPQWFQAALTRIGGVNQYREPIFKLVWSENERMVIGGRWKNGFEGYKQAPAIPGEPCWALMVWEPAEVSGGSYESWQRDFRDEETGLLAVGGYPKYGAYRVLQKFLHREIIQQPQAKQVWDGPIIRTVVTQQLKTRTYKMEPCGFMLDVMLPILMAWRRLSNHAKVAALRQQEQERKDEHMKRVKDARDGTRMGRTMRSSQLVQKRAEVIERGMKQAMALASQCGLGMRLET
jgi:hypothetical protein